MNILAIETSTDYLSLALLHDGTVSSVHEFLPKQHAQHLIPQLNQLLQKNNQPVAELEGIIISHGPGSFTGVRFAMAAAQALAFAHDLPIVTVSSLQVMAQVAHVEYQADAVLAAVDARLGQCIYGGFCLNEATGLMQPYLEERRAMMEKFKAPDSESLNWLCIGQVWQQPQLQQFIEQETGLTGCSYEVFPNACAMIDLAQEAFKLGKSLNPKEIPTDKWLMLDRWKKNS